MDPILFLHGALGSSVQLKSFSEKFPAYVEVHCLNFGGHGGLPVTDQAFSIPLFAQDVLSWIHRSGHKRIRIFGYSMGGYVALYLARHYPEYVSGVVTLATKFDWSPATAQKEVKLLNPDLIEMKVPAFAEMLSKRHAPVNWKLVMHHTAQMMLSLGNDPVLHASELKQIKVPCLLGSGDKDNMVSVAETIAAQQSIPDAGLYIIPDTLHPMEKVNGDLLYALVSGRLLAE